LLIDLKLDGKTVMVIGGGSEAYRKTQSALDSGAKIWVISRDFSEDMQRLEAEGKVALLKTEIKDAKAFVDSLNPKPDMLLAITDNSKLNLELIKTAKSYGCMVYSVDNPVLSDFILPAVAHISDVKIAISTGGRSPAMARALRERIEKFITIQDLAEIDLQDELRRILKERFSDPKVRRKLLFEILNNEAIKDALVEGKFDVAQQLSMKIIERGESKE
jgi:precorrin-2 dehydrogenase/sirohydrochlorin ferrochelatase